MGTVCHKDNSFKLYHSVAFVEKPVLKEECSTLIDHWTLYNDKRIIIADGTEVTKCNGYIYFFSQ